MSRLRIAHFSDVHVLSLKGIGPRRFLNKRWTGAVNLALNRVKHYRVEVFEQLIEAVGALGVDHTICSGDLVNLALEPEYSLVKTLLTAAFAPDALTVVPGNHDYYTREAADAGWFEAAFADYLPHDLDLGGGGYPVVRLLDGLAIFGLSSAIPTPSFVAAGEVGTAQRARLALALAHPEVAARFKLVMLHHPMRPDPSRRLEGLRRLRDVAELTAELGRAAPDLVVHGHNHAFKREAILDGVPVVQVGSGSRFGAHKRAEFNVYVIEAGRLVQVERHIHDQSSGRFVACDEAGSPLVSA